VHPVLVQVSVGELLDKLVILELKASRIAGEVQQRNIQAELQMLRRTFAELELDIVGFDELLNALRRVNGELWQIEDDLRSCEKQQRFDSQFVHLARSVYLMNDERAALKHRINVLCGSLLREEKHYVDYDRHGSSST